ncbi:MAG TPA: efflux RND transporter periplasmic adaptor subunit [Opitutaceae bacterium]|nr:efflux RND transporter periplasmic adaptor subunit [Opitutaceae bacterium]
MNPSSRSTAPVASANPSIRPASARRHWLGWTILVVVVLAIAYAAVIRPLFLSSVSERGGAGGRPLPVTAEPARKADLNVRIVALGTVTPVSTVTVRSRVDGQLQKIFFKEGQEVEAGAPLVEIDPRPFEVQKQQTEAQLAKDNALLVNARLDFERFTTLLAQDSVAKQQVDTQAALVRQYEASVKLDQAQIDTAALQLAYAHITAPIAGRVGLRLVDLGNMIHASDPNGIVVITQLRPITVVFAIPQDALPGVLKRFQAGDPMTVEAFDRDGRTLLATGRLVTIDNQIDPTTGTVKLRAEFPNTDEVLFPSQFVNVQLIAAQIQGATVVSTAAVQRGTAGTYVYVVNDKDGQKTASVRVVETGASERGMIAITKGLAPGDVVVVDGVDKLREGTAVDLVDRVAGAPGAAGPGMTKGAGGPGRKGGRPQQN